MHPARAAASIGSLDPPPSIRPILPSRTFRLPKTATSAGHPTERPDTSPVSTLARSSRVVEQWREGCCVERAPGKTNWICRAAYLFGNPSRIKVGQQPKTGEQIMLDLRWAGRLEGALPVESGPLYLLSGQRYLAPRPTPACYHACALKKLTRVTL